MRMECCPTASMKNLPLRLRACLASTRCAVIAAIFAPSLLLADAVVTFNEINYNPLVTQDNEWVELYNQMSVNIDMSGWQLANGISYTFPQGTIIPAKGTIIVAKSTGNPALSGAGIVLGPFGGSLSNSGETLELRSRSNRIMDQVTYSDHGDWPVAADGAGATLAKKVPGSDSQVAASWTAGATIGGTPGAINFPGVPVPIQRDFVTTSSTWKFSDTNVPPAAGWTNISFDDSGWSSGAPVFGTAGTSPILAVTGDLVQRWRAGAITGIGNGGTVTSWSDEAIADGVSQNGASTGTPTLVTNGANGQPVVNLNGSSSVRASVPPGIGGATGFVYFIVCKANATNAAGTYIYDRDFSQQDNPLVSLMVVNGNHYALQKRSDSGANLGGPVSTSTVSASNYQIVAVRRNPTVPQFEMWVDGVLQGTTSDDGANLTPQPIVLGGHGGGAAQFNGRIAELLIYKSGLSDSDFRSVGAYLASSYGLTTSFPTTTVTTPLSTTTSATYLRKAFSVTGDPTRTSLRLNSTVADGAVFYLNGQEINRVNLPSGAVTGSTPALSNISQPSPSGFQVVSSSALVSGSNVLAVELHKAASDTSNFFTAELSGSELPVDTSQPLAFQINELAATTDSPFFVELRNVSASAASTSGYTISIAGGSSFTLPTVSVPAGGYVSYTRTQLGFKTSADDKVVLTGPGGRIADAQIAALTRGGRSDAYPGAWLHPSATTQDSANVFNLTKDIIINEICYKAPKLAGIVGSPAVTTSTSVVSYGSSWRRNETTTGLATGWASTAHVAGTGGWLAAAAGTFSYPNPYTAGTLPLTPATTLAPSTAGRVTYYFETDFSLTASNAANLTSLTISHLMDDGGLIYFNGTEISRYNMPAGTITPNTISATGRAVPTIVGPVTITIPAGLAVSGTNRISVEVHESSSTSSDAVFALQATANIITTPEVVAVPEANSTQQWIELYNRGTTTVDLSGWSFDQGVSYVFPAGTTMAPGTYKVITGDGTAPPANPSLQVLGPWSGKLSGAGEKVELIDASGNIANQVAYVDNGRWPDGADGGGSTLELRDPHADNTIPESWAASDESSRRGWESFTYTGVASPSAVGPDGQYNEFILGLLSDGEVLIDDISVIESPGGSAVAMVSNGNFESGTTGWRFLGNHRDARVIADPSNSSNHVLYLHADGATEHMHNHVETTLANSRTVTNGRTYQISFRAKWLSGINKLNTRLYFDRLAKTSILTRTQVMGTPGTANSRQVTNIGPGFTYLTHFPVVPQPGEPVTITARASDPDGVGSASLYYSPNGGAFVSVPMTASGDGSTFTGSIPGFAASAVVQFYVAATDSAATPVTSCFPAAGPSSHAIYQVNDGLAATNGLNNIRIVMNPVDKALLYQANNLMSNGRIDCTVIYNESEIYYNAGVRLKSSERGRQNSQRLGFNLSFDGDQLFRGVLNTVAIDRSEGQVTGAQEILYNHMMYASGGIPAEVNDLCKVMAPDPAHTSTAILQLARFSAEFLDNQFDNGSDGTVYEYELIYYPTTVDANGYKLPQPDNVIGTNITSLGDDKENYRLDFITKGNEDKDDYTKVIAMCKLFDESSSSFDTDVDNVIDVDQWLRSLAYSCAIGATDSFYSNAQHNGQFYARPHDGRMLYFPHDYDNGYTSNLPILMNRELLKITANPGRLHLYLNHLYDICHTVFNQSYMSTWTAHFGSLLPNEDFPGHLNYINTRSNFILSQISSTVPQVTFAITTNGGVNFQTSDSPVILDGVGWVDVRNIRLAGSATPLVVTWTGSNTWQTAVPLNAGANVINLEALDAEGNVAGTAGITVTNVGSVRLPDSSNLVVSQLFYHPAGNGLAEYVELLNISPSGTLDLSGLTFSKGITYTFANGTTLAPGARTVVIKDTASFQALFGTSRPVAATLFTGSFDNAGEQVTIRRTDNTVVRDFTYDDKAPWPTLADTSAYAIVLVNPYSNPDHNDPLNWRASVVAGGNPGFSDTTEYATWKASNGNLADNADTDGDGFSTFAEYVLGGNPQSASRSIAPTFTQEAGGTMLMTVTRRADIGAANVYPQFSTDLVNWQSGGTLVANDRIAGTPAVDRLQFRFTPPVGAPTYFIRVAMH